VVLGACQTDRVPSRAAPKQAPAAPRVVVPDQPVAPAPVPAPEPAPAPSVTLTPPPGVNAMVPVALLVPLSGKEAAIGADILNAASMAVFEVGGDSFQLLPRDTGGTAEQARRAVVEALSEGARLVLGPVFATAVAEAAPIAAQQGVNVIAFSNDSRVAGTGTYLLGLTPRQQIRRIVSYARTQGLSRFAALLPGDAYGRRVEQDLRDAVAASGGELSRIAVYAPDGSDLNPVIRRLASYDARKAALDAQKKALASSEDEVARETRKRLDAMDTVGGPGFDALLIAEGGARLTAIAALLPYYDIDPRQVRLLGLAAWDGAKLSHEPALVGGWYVAPPPDARAGFDARFRDAFGHTPGPLAWLGYDATALAAVLARAPEGPNFAKSALTQPNGYAGAGGIFRLMTDGEAETGLAVLEVTRNGSRVVSPAPSTFAAPPTN
jgi:ABC-type branched-subunit amino acid transport system substrate-binding protein